MSFPDLCESIGDVYEKSTLFISSYVCVIRKSGLWFDVDACRNEKANHPSVQTRVVQKDTEIYQSLLLFIFLGRFASFSYSMIQRYRTTKSP
jgi:hypothetical protein